MMGPYCGTNKFKCLLCESKHIDVRYKCKGIYNVRHYLVLYCRTCLFSQAIDKTNIVNSVTVPQIARPAKLSGTP